MSDYAERVKAANTDATLRNLDEWANRQKPDPVQQAVDDYILMERKAQAWDQLKAAVGRTGGGYLPIRLDDLDFFMSL